MDKNQLKQKLCAAIDANRQAIIDFGKLCRSTPELGYHEFETSAAVKAKLESIGVQDITPTAVTGLKGWIYGKNGKNHNASVMVLGELDAVVSQNHHHANPTTGAAHACGHAAQLAVMIGSAIGIFTIAQYLDGDVCFAAAPAEEFLQIEERQAMRDAGKISWFGGKQQMIAEGAFDDIDMAMMVHAAVDVNERTTGHVVTGGASLGFIGKKIRFIGKESHAAVAPWLGVNALNAATLSIQAIHALRETFGDKDSVRVHPIITKGGDIVNTIPADVRMECGVRANTSEAIKRVNAQVNRAINGCAHAMGVEVEILDIPGYYPLMQNTQMGELFTANAHIADPTVHAEDGIPFGGSTDMGDITWLIPAIQPCINGFKGALHSSEFDIADEELAYILPAKLLAMTVVDLLADGATTALEIKKAQPRKSKEEFAALWAGMLE